VGTEPKIAALSHMQAEIFYFSTFVRIRQPEMKMAKFSGSDSFIGFLDLKNVGLEPKIVSLSRSQAEISLFEGFQLSPPSLRGQNFYSMLNRLIC
jgi:hypothetical protein